jgi:glycosyltransferase involved in cell wall biosynthesis
MRALLLSHSGGTGGATRSLQAVAADLQSGGGNVDILAPDGNMHKEWRKAGIDVITWKPPYCPWLLGPVYSSGVVSFHPILIALLVILPVRLWACWKVLKRVLEGGSYDCIHINSLTLFPLAWILPRVVRRQKQKPRVIWHLRELLNPSLFSPVRRLIVKMIEKNSDHIIAITENEAELFKNHQSIEIIYNTIPAKWNSEKIELSHVTNDKVKVVMASALSAAKGLKEYLETAKKINSAQPSVHFDLFTPQSSNSFVCKFPVNQGTENSVNQMLNEMQMLQLSNGVRWRFGCAITPSLYRDYSIYVRPDRAACPWGRDIIEAMWMGMPVIATGDYEGFVVDGHNGFLVPAGDVNALEDRIKMLALDADLQQRMSIASYTRAREIFAPEVHAQKIRAAFGLSE